MTAELEASTTTVSPASCGSSAPSPTHSMPSPATRMLTPTRNSGPVRSARAASRYKVRTAPHTSLAFPAYARSKAPGQLAKTAARAAGSRAGPAITAASTGQQYLPADPIRRVRFTGPDGLGHRAHTATARADSLRRDGENTGCARTFPQAGVMESRWRNQPRDCRAAAERTRSRSLPHGQRWKRYRCSRR